MGEPASQRDEQARPGHLGQLRVAQAQPAHHQEQAVPPGVRPLQDSVSMLTTNSHKLDLLAVKNRLFRQGYALCKIQ